MNTQQKITSVIATFVACVVAGCGSGDKSPTPATPVQPVVKQPVAPADPTLRMAHAVVSGKSGAAVDLKYEILSKPQPGKPFEIDLALIPGAVLDSMTVNVTATPGLTVASSAEGSFGKLAIGEVARHQITLVAEHADVVYLTVTATTYAVGLSSSRSFAIPVIVSDPPPPTAAAETAPVQTTAEKK